MKKVRLLLLPLTLLWLLTLPVLGAEISWRTTESEFEKGYVAQQIKARPEEYAAFDAERRYSAEYPMDQEVYMADCGIDEEQFRAEMWAIELGPEIRRAYGEAIVAAYEETFPGDLDAVGIPWALMLRGHDSVETWAAETAGDHEYGGDVQAAWRDLATEYISCRQRVADTHDRAQQYRAQYPGSYEEFDPYVIYTPGWEYLIRHTMDSFAFRSEEEFKEHSYVNSHMPDYIQARERAAKRQEYPARWPEEYAAFDEGAWFRHYEPTYDSPESYREHHTEYQDLPPEAFKQDMFVEWADREYGFFDGYCVTVNGTPIPFWQYKDEKGKTATPRAENNRILIPLRAAAEALGLTVEWKPETRQVICSGEKATVTFTLNSTRYSGGTLDVAPYAENGITYLPLRALGETLGCGVAWYQDFVTAALTTGK